MSTPAIGNPARTTAIDCIDAHVVIEGAGASNPTNTYVAGGATVTRTGTGAYRITWSGWNGPLVGAVAGLMADTPANLAGHTVVFDYDSYTKTTLALDFTLYNAADSAHDLAANEFLNVVATFRRTSVVK